MGILMSEYQYCHFVGCDTKRRGRDALAERLTAAPVIQAFLVLTPLILRVFYRNILVSPFSTWLGDHVNGGLVKLRLKPVYRR